MGDFALDISRFVAKANGNIDAVIKKIIFEIGLKVVERSPVGDPTYWKGRFIKSEGNVDFFTGVDDAGDYVGGAFRANWQHGYGTMPTTKFDTKGANDSIARINTSLATSPAIGVHWIVNNLPYSIALENGHSWHQAPQGIVKITVIEYPNIVNEQAREVNR